VSELIALFIAGLLIYNRLKRICQLRRDEQRERQRIETHTDNDGR
jgi:hypothetical protein